MTKILKRRIPVTLGMIVKNEERLLPQCLETVYRRVAELMIVDTGSRDRTVEIARKFGARILSRPGPSDGGMDRDRNLYLRHASQPWILSLDADERIASKDVLKIGELIRRKADGYCFNIRNYGDEYNLLRGWHPNKGEYPVEEKFAGTYGWATNRVTRLFRRDARYTYEGVHLLIEASIRRHGGIVWEAPFPLHHFECLKDRSFFLKKQRKYLRQGLKELKSSLDPAKTHLDVAIGMFAVKKDDAAALLHLRRALRLRPGYTDVHKLLGVVYLETGETSSAKRHLETALRARPKDPDLHCLLGAALMARGRNGPAIESLKKALRYQKDHPMAWCALGVAYESQNHLSAASEAYRRSLRILPTFAAARENSSRLARKMDRG